MSAHPVHLAIIMDGNGRWATARRMPRLAGHKAGAETVRRVIEASPGLGVRTLTLYAFSSDNWKRPQAEVEQQIRHSVDSAQLFRIFPEWNRLPTLLLKDSGTALDLGLAPLIAIAVGRPADQVERRLRAAPPDRMQRR